MWLVFSLGLPGKMVSLGKYRQVIVDIKCFLPSIRKGNSDWVVGGWSQAGILWSCPSPCGMIGKTHLNSVIFWTFT